MIDDRAVASAPEGSGHTNGAELVVEGLVARYQDLVAVHGVDLRVEPGSCVAVLGTNGAGKSTLLRNIVGLHRPSNGHISVDGDRIERRQPHEIARLGVRFVPEGRGVFPDLTVKENLQISVGRSRQLQETALSRFPVLKSRYNSLAGTLSGGEQQMLAIAPALSYDYRILLADELSLGLAPILVEEIFEVLSEIRASGVSILIVDQFADRILSQADWSYVLRKGVVVFDGPASELQDRSEYLQSLYMGGPEVK